MNNRNKKQWINNYLQTWMMLIHKLGIGILIKILKQLKRNSQEMIKH